MNENINLVEILRDVPKGTPLWSPIYGEVEFHKIVEQSLDYPISVKLPDGEFESFARSGRLYADYTDAECMLFPSREQRDWSKFVAPGRKKVTVAVFPFDKVLVRDLDIDIWTPTFLCRMSNDPDFPYLTTGLISYKQIIPYCQETAHLVGTANQCPIDYEIKPIKSCG